jgi:hypothetical protein
MKDTIKITMKNKDTVKGILIGIVICFAIDMVNSLILKIIIVLTNQP